MTKVLVIDDQRIAREYMENVVKNGGDYELVGSLSKADLAETVCRRSQVDLVLMDVCTHGTKDGIDAAAELRRLFPKLKMIVVTSMVEESYIKRAREAGVDSFWYKEVSPEPIIELMDRTMNGERVFPDTTPKIKFGNAMSTDFTERELEVLRELTSGDTNTEIAKRLYIAPGTVKNYIQYMLEKTGFKSRTELAVKAREAGLVILDDRINDK